MAFRSLTADQTLMDIYTKTIESDHPEEGIQHCHAVPELIPSIFQGG